MFDGFQRARAIRRPAAATITAAAALTLALGAGSSVLEAQQRAQGGQAAQAAQQQAPQTPRSAAPLDLTGYWVAMITEDWQYRMITPPKGDYAHIPINAEARRIAEQWDPARDEAAGEACKGYAAPAIMRLPVRLNIQWQDDQTLRIDIDNGQQTRLFHFNPAARPGERSWQGHSVAQWLREGGRGGGSLSRHPPGASLKVDTTNLRAGYLRKNGIPFSEQTFMTEYFSVLTEDNGDRYLAVQTFVEDPVYLRDHWVRTLLFKREPDGSKFEPAPCVADGWGTRPTAAAGRRAR